MEQKATSDCQKIISFMESHPLFNDMYNAFIKGPKPGCGFMWTPDDWWVGEEKSAVKIVSDKVLEYGWDSSGYGWMMRLIEQKLRELPVTTAEIVENNLLDEEQLTWKQKAGIITDQERVKYDLVKPPVTPEKLESPLYNNVENPEEEDEKLDQEKSFAKGYKQTEFGKSMDENNKNALDVMANKGMNEAGKYMMSQAGGDYAKMRSMFG